MARIITKTVVIEVSKLVRGDDVATIELPDNFSETIEQIANELMSDDLIAEVTAV